VAFFFCRVGSIHAASSSFGKLGKERCAQCGATRPSMYASLCLRLCVCCRVGVSVCVHGFFQVSMPWMVLWMSEPWSLEVLRSRASYKKKNKNRYASRLDGSQNLNVDVNDAIPKHEFSRPAQNERNDRHALQAQRAVP
jgi:hypothetical protein